MSQIKLYYVYDPMCAWCWGFKPTWQKIKAQLPKQCDVIYVLGGLAPDSDQPMPIQQRQAIESYWYTITEKLGTEFNHQFWQLNTPRRSTYPSCRAVLAARKQDRELQMYAAIQEAYYLQAKNPSDDEILIAAAASIALDIECFKLDYYSETLNQEFGDELKFARSIGGNSFPSLIVDFNGQFLSLPLDYINSKSTIDKIKQLI
ncbi:DsbA family protein [Vibrio sp. SS-MA-C1-2]|uniref:DsbA family protein n=1 Tax=Vibrio sp. SS-MA-C1-2 TaxID=2908646 RepID=UPI001F23C874|nr:DsbA family protein [Vibrio sp. SS-MA-C1-2]UJF20025.1 DsbA family protein [Vibrio sp. SS-MA-C1-2]